MPSMRWPAWASGWKTTSQLSRRRAAEADDVAVGVLDVEILRAPLRRREWLEDLRTVGNALPIECLDALHARGGVEMLVLSPMLPLRRILRRLFKVQFQAISATDRIEPAPRFGKDESERIVVIRH